MNVRVNVNASGKEKQNPCTDTHSFTGTFTGGSGVPLPREMAVEEKERFRVA